MKEDKDISPLDGDMLDIVSKKLVSFDDLFNFSAVCKEWRAVHKIYWRKFLESQSPLIVQTTRNAKRFYSFYSIPEKRAYSSKLSYFRGKSYCGSSSGYLVMAGANNILQLMNPFTRKQKIIDISVVRKDLTYFACRVLLAFTRDSDEFVLVASCKRFLAEIGVLSLNSESLKFLKLKNTPNVPSWSYSLLSCDAELLVVDFVPNKVLDVYRIDWETMSYVKLQTLGERALFHSPYKCYALANPGKWGFESNRVYSIDWDSIDRDSAECEVYSGSNNELVECIMLAGSSREVRSRSTPYWLDWCFRNQHDEVDYSLVE
ncbi:uncharacterized protein LOC123891952 [Trifolium pratense]|uniref:uncharacterized protein LOC123891952 n=1 Tax=Trifolium pratense TaxID=57577 RepID=UPI001E6958E9|nr:uncharacterized protein LOC123891952 [Trifolium pratense]